VGYHRGTSITSSGDPVVRTRVHDGLPPEWPYDSATSVPFMATRKWFSLLPDALPEPRLTFVVQPGPVAFHAALVEHPDAPPPVNLAALLNSRGPVLAAGRATSVELVDADLFPNLVVTLPGVACFPVPNMNPPPPVVSAAIREIIRAARERGCRAVAVLYLWPEAQSTRDAIDDLGFRPFAMEVRSDFHVSFRAFDGYLSGLRRSQRRQALRDLRHLGEAGVRTVQRPLAEVSAEVLALRLHHRRRYGLPPDEARQQAMIERIGRLYGPDDAVSVFCAYQGDRIVRFTLALRHERTWLMLWTGCAEGDTATDLTYFDTSFYTPLRLAPSQGIDTILYGLGTAEAKARRGCSSAVLTGHVLSLR
jgi:hypothetical protein